MFDAQGNRITPSHTAKGSKRYRYYAGPVNKDGEAGTLRVPAQELDGAVVAALTVFLDDEARVLNAVGGSELQEVQRVLRTAKEFAAALDDGAESAIRADAVHALVERVIVHPSQLQIQLRAEAFDPGEDTLDAEQLSIEVPMQIKRAGKVSRLVIGGGATLMRRPDPKLIALAAKAQDWFERLRSGKSSSVDAIAQAEGVSGSYVTRLIYLAFLAPDIVERIRRGEQPVELTVDRIQRMVPLPACWEAQRTLLCFEG